MIAINLLDSISVHALTRWLKHEQEQALLRTSVGIVLLFHGSTDAYTNQQQLVRYKSLLPKADKYVCCHAAHMPAWVQAKCLTVGTGTVTVSNYGDSNMYLQQN